MIKLILCKEIYSRENILSTISAYRDYATIILNDVNDKYELIFRKCKYSKKITIKEFENYLIGLENS